MPRLKSPPAPKNRRPNPHLSCPFLNRHFKIMTHTHRQHRQRQPANAGQFVPHFTQPHKIRPHSLRILQKRRNTHQPANLQIFQRTNLFQQRRQPRNLRPTLRRLIFNAHFNQYSQLPRRLQFRPCAIQPLRHTKIIHRIHAMKRLRRPRRLITLQMPNQVPRPL